MTARLIEQPAVRMRLLAAVAATPPGVKLNIPRLRDALINQGDVLAGLQRLVAKGSLDGTTLRPPEQAARQDGRKFHLGDGQPSKPLFDALKAEAQRRGLKLQNVSIAIWNNKARIYRLLDNASVRRSTAAKIQAWLDASKAQAVDAGSAPVGRGKAGELAAPLLAEIEAFIATGAMSKTHFINECLRSCSAWPRMAKPGATIRPETAVRVRAFMAAHQDPRDKPGTSGAQSAGRHAPTSGLANGPTVQRQARTPDTAPVTIDPPAKIDPQTDVLRPTFLKPAEIAWCSQCDQRVSGAAAGRCTSRWCSLKEGKAA